MDAPLWLTWPATSPMDCLIPIFSCNHLPVTGRPAAYRHILAVAPHCTVSFDIFHSERATMYRPTIIHLCVYQDNQRNPEHGTIYLTTWNVFLVLPPPLCGGLYIFALRKLCMTVQKYEQRAVYKRYDVVGNGPDSVLESSGAIHRVN